MSFLLYDLILLAAFVLFIIIFLATHRKNVKREGIMVLYKSKFGIKAINYIGTRYKKFLSGFEYIIIFTGYILMILAIYLILQLVKIFSVPAYVQAIKIPPIMPLIPYLPALFKISFLPDFYFTTWIIVILIAATPHEFFHGIFAKMHGIKIKSTGFAFLGPFAGAFVEPDEKHVEKIKPKHQIAFLGAGVFANLIAGLVFLLVLWVFFAASFSPAGVIFNGYQKSIINISEIQGINDSALKIGGVELSEIKVNDASYYILKSVLEDAKKANVQFIEAYDDTPALRAGIAGAIVEVNGNKIKTQPDLEIELAKTSPGQEISIKTLFNGEEKEYSIKLIKHPQNESKGYLGITTVNVKALSFLKRIIGKAVFFKDPNTFYQPKFSGELAAFIYNLLWWIVLACFSVAIVNMLPIGIFDGGRVFYLTILWITKSKKASKIGYKISTWFFILVFFLLTFLWFISTFF